MISHDEAFTCIDEQVPVLKLLLRWESYMKSQIPRILRWPLEMTVESQPIRQNIFILKKD